MSGATLPGRADREAALLHLLQQGVTTARAMVRDLMGVRAVAIVTWQELLRGALPPGGREGDALEQLAVRQLQAAMAAAPPQPAGPASELRAGGPPRRLPLGAGQALVCPFENEMGEVMGVIALREEAPETPETGARLDRAARLVGLHLSGVTGKVELELDLIAARRRINRLERLNRTDPLTGLQNKTAFEASYAEGIATAQGPLALVILDVDHFKSVNDLYGHQFGDGYLRSLSLALGFALPETATLGRVGGDEFAILLELPQHGQPYLEAVMERCRTAVLRATATLGKPDLGKVSMGAALYPDHARDADTLYELADSALYLSKSEGRGGQTVFDPTRHQAFNPREIGRRFRQAAQDGLIRPYYQPIYDLRDGRCLGVEMLARWCDAQFGLMTPEQFPGIFHDHENAELLTRVLVAAALADLSALRRRGAARPVLSINMTSFDLINPEFVFDLQALLSDNPAMDWDSITIEVTETIIMGAPSGQVFRSLEELRRRGARVVLDDFGTGYGGLRHLSGWPIDGLKIDRSFVQRMTESATDAAIVEALLNLADRAGLSVVAEGIETEAQLQALRAMGCRAVQGYLLAVPMPAERLDRLVAPLALPGLPGPTGPTGPVRREGCG
jgi:diguanylate cyclase (GGDEF)-like protein